MPDHSASNNPRFDAAATQAWWERLQAEHYANPNRSATFSTTCLDCRKPMHSRDNPIPEPSIWERLCRCEGNGVVPVARTSLVEQLDAHGLSEFIRIAQVADPLEAVLA